ncbi:MAG: hypothetical protein Q7T96_19920 [Methylobacter sp.]|nr:hypothetical protein [Methylobacter sp.]
MKTGEHESKTFTDEQLIDSPTLKKLTALSLILPINASNPKEVDDALAPSFVWLVDALDNNAIDFQNNADKQALLQIMLVSYQLISQIRPLPTIH